MQHIAGGYVVSHISSLFLKNKYWMVCLIVPFVKEIMDHFLFDCGGNETKHLIDISSWLIGGITYHLIVLLKRKKYGWK
jgi:hypothetical protein